MGGVSVSRDRSRLMQSQIGSIFIAVIQCLFVEFGGGHHQDGLASADITSMKKLGFANRIVFQFVICTTKLGICAFYLRVFHDKFSKWFIYALLAIIAALAIAMEFTIIFSCSPVSDAWSLGKKHCIPFAPSFIANTSCNIAIDLALMIFVIPKISMHLVRWDHGTQYHSRSRANKRSISTSLLGWDFSSSSLRFFDAYQFSNTSTAAISRVSALSLSLRIQSLTAWPGERVNVGIWVSVEVSTGLFCASAPCLKPFIRKMFPGLASTFSSTISKTPTPDDGDIKTIKSRRHSMQSHKSAFIPHLKKAFSRKAKTGLEEVKLKTIKAKRHSRGTFAYAIRKRDDAFQEGDLEDLRGGASVENWLGRIVDEEAVKKAAATVALSDGDREFARIGRRMSGVSSIMSSG